MTKNAPVVDVAPTAKFTLGGQEYCIEFNLEHLMRIEDAAGVPIMALAEQHLDQLAVRDADGKPVAKPTNEQSAERFKSVPASKMRTLVAICIPMPVEAVPLAGVVKAFMSLASALSQACSQMMGARDDDEDVVTQRPTAASGS